jgi:hypothetical protein
MTARPRWQVSDERLTEIIRGPASEVGAMATELRDLRATVAADSQRIRQVVIDEINSIEELAGHPHARRIADRVAAQLAAPLAEDEIATSATGCPVHYGAVHGGEAQELRRGIEEIVENYADGEDTYGFGKRLQQLLDRVDARDSLAHVEMHLTDIIIRRLHDTSERAPGVHAVPMRLVRQDVLDELLATRSLP